MQGANANFHTFLTGHAVSAMGGKMQAAALLWHIYQLTGSAVALGVLGAVELLPIVLFSAVGGVAADRYDRRWVLGLSQAAQALPALLLAVLTSLEFATIWVIYAVAATGAAVQAFDTPARKALVPQLVEPEGLARALSAMDLTKNLAKLGGPALMGVLVAWAGLPWVYLLNALSFGVMIVVLLQLPAATGRRTAKGRGIVAPFLAGIRFVRDMPVVRSLIVLDFVATLLAGAEALLPMVADRVLGIGVLGYGLLSSSVALGALLGGAILLWRPPRRRLGRMVLGSVAVYGLATIGFGLASHALACFAALVVLGAADTVSTVLRNTLLQLRTPDAFRGRISAVNLVFSKSGPRLGQLEAGLVAGWIGVTGSIVSGGVLCLGALAWMTWRHPVLRELNEARD